MTDTRTVYVSIGNSDDKLSQFEWSSFVTETDILLRPRGDKADVDHDPFWPVKARHGNWRSVPDDPWQNACWCIEVEDEPEAIGFMCDELAALAKAYRQDSISWAEATTEFIGAAREVHAREDVPALLAEIERLRAECVQFDEANTGLGRALTEARAALAAVEQDRDRLSDELARVEPVLEAAQAWRRWFPHADSMFVPENALMTAVDALEAAEPTAEPTQRKLPVCASCGHRHRWGGECADHSWNDACPYDAGADCELAAEDTAEMQPCQPIGCDNGHHIEGCRFAEIDAAVPGRVDGSDSSREAG